MRKFILFILPVILILLIGCSAQPPVENTNRTTSKTIVSPISIIEEKETIITGESVINDTTKPNITLNITVPAYKYEPNATLFIYFINVSYIPQWGQNVSNERQGEAILLKKGDADVLIDTGAAQTALYLVNFLKERGVDDIELLVLTHARKENYGGMDAILNNFIVEQFMWNEDDGGDFEYAALVRKAMNRTRKTITAKYLSVQNINGINFLQINPHDGSSRFFTTDNDGIVFKITDRNLCLMTTGDIAYGAQVKITDSKDFDPKCNILQIPNYGLGSGTSNIDVFLLKVAPKIAIITGSYFDPANERYTIYEKLKLKGIKAYSTFVNNNGTKSTNVVRIMSDGLNYSISTQ